MDAAAVYLPKGACLAWDYWMVWSQAAADSAFVGAYLITAVVFLTVARRRPLLRASPPLWWSAVAVALFLLCGAAVSATNVVSLWVPLYRVQTALKALAALILGVAGPIIALRLSPGLKAYEIAAAADARRIDALVAQTREHAEAYRRSRAMLQEDVSDLEALVQRIDAAPGTIPIGELVSGLRQIAAELRAHLGEA